MNWADCMKDYINMIDEYCWRSIEIGRYRSTLAKVIGNTGVAEDMIVQGNKNKVNEKRCLCELRGALQSRQRMRFGIL